LTVTPALVAADIRQAIAAGASGTIYAPWFWRPIMALVRALPEKLFVRTNL
jgi:hypothetical protein